MIYVQFSDSTDSEIVSYFCCPQDPAEHPNQGEVDATDSRWDAFYNKQSAQVQPYLPVPVSA